MNKQMIISVMAKDRPGIIAEITGAIYALKGDLADLNQSILCGYLTMILIASFEEEVTREDVLAEISHIQSGERFDVLIKEMDIPIEIAHTPLPSDTYILTAQGKNRSGLVHSISQFCYSHGINILDLATTLNDDQYTMVLQLDMRKISSIETVTADLEIFSRDSGLRLVIQHNDIFRVTNEITLH
jgi:glycine cleavage system transcriptional repressor